MEINQYRAEFFKYNKRFFLLNSLWSSIIWSLKDGIECQIIKYIANPAIRDAILKITNKRATKIISSKKLKEINFFWYMKNDNIIVIIIEVYNNIFKNWCVMKTLVISFTITITSSGEEKKIIEKISIPYDV